MNNDYILFQSFICKELSSTLMHIIWNMYYESQNPSDYDQRAKLNHSSNKGYQLQTFLLSLTGYNNYHLNWSSVEEEQKLSKFNLFYKSVNTSYTFQTTASIVLISTG